jgi:hypothetical protein
VAGHLHNGSEQSSDISIVIDDKNCGHLLNSSMAKTFDSSRTGAIGPAGESS